MMICILFLRIILSPLIVLGLLSLLEGYAALKAGRLIVIFLLFFLFVPQAHAEILPDDDLVTICRVDNLERWNTAFAAVEQQFQQVIPTVIVSAFTTPDCDITVIITKYPVDCSSEAYGQVPQAIGCTSGSTVWIWDGSNGKVAVLLHELLHAYGMNYHSACIDSAVSPVYDPSITELPFCDIQALRALGF